MKYHPESQNRPVYSENEKMFTIFLFLYYQQYGQFPQVCREKGRILGKRYSNNIIAN